MKKLQPSRSISIALVLVLLAFFSSKFQIEGHRDLRDLQISKEIKEKFYGGEQDSLRRIPKSHSSPIQNRRGPSRKHQIASSRVP
ncbi:hypothetical protein V5N11_033602 [Cardamine amara subsp. amara]|uniref:Uncharacterized protein n=1 Tax=Cardamine amara subsp. amara TaxID=228776 RepID=A0ABD1ANG4_CARAN